MIYNPLDNFTCLEIPNNDTIRVYTDPLQIGQRVSYRDYYPHSDYVFSEHNIELVEMPNCVSNSLITNKIYYRYDFLNILILFLVLAFIIFYVPSKLFLRFFVNLETFSFLATSTSFCKLATNI